MNDVDIEVKSLYGAQTRQGLVRLVVGSEAVQVSPSKAREIAGYLIEAATAAEGDEVLMEVLNRAGMSASRAAQVLMAMRRERALLEKRARRDLLHARLEDQGSG